MRNKRKFWRRLWLQYKNLQGHKIAARFADIHTFEIYRLTNIRYIIGDFETYEEYAAHSWAETEAWFDELRADLGEEDD